MAPRMIAGCVPQSLTREQETDEDWTSNTMIITLNQINIQFWKATKINEFYEVVTIRRYRYTAQNIQRKNEITLLNSLAQFNDFAIF